MSAREIVATLTPGPRRDAVLEALQGVEFAQKQLHQAIRTASLAEEHLRGVLAAAADESGKGLKYDPATSSIYREVQPAGAGEPKPEGDSE